MADRLQNAEVTEARRWRLPTVGIACCVLLAGLSVATSSAGWPAPCAAVVLVGAAIAADRRRVKRGDTAWSASRRLRVLAAGLAGSLAAEVLRAVAPDGVGSGAPWELPAIAAVVITVAGVWWLLAARVGDRALDMVLESGLAAVSLAVVVWNVVAEPGIASGRLSATMIVGPLARVAVCLVWVSIAWRLNGVGTANRTPSCGLALGASIAFGGSVAALVGVVSGHPSTALATAASAATVAGVGLAAVALCHPAAVVEPAFVRTMAAGLSFARFAGVVVAVLLVPAITLGKVLAGQPATLSSMAICSALLSLVVVAYLAGLLREWARTERRAQHDELTGLPNRREFHDRLTDLVADAERTDSRVAVMFLDLDRFKQVNDTLGHASGNALLTTIAARLADEAPIGATVARMQGDEFALAVPLAGGVAESLTLARRLLSAISIPVVIARQSIHVSASVGVAHFPLDGREPETLLRSADRAMYRAKELGRNRAEAHSPELQAAAEGRFDIDRDLHGAIGRGEMRLLYQPKVDLQTGQVTGAEALLRWNHPTLGMIGPDEFIPVAEDNGLIVELGEWALLTACTQLKRWHSHGFPELCMAVNLSPRQFQLQGVADMVASALRQTRVEPHLLELELTESLALQNVDVVSDTLADLHALGVRCSVDDFGTGWSGLSYLSHFRLTGLKIDKSFLRGIADDDGGGESSQASIVVGIIALARGLNLRVTAEGVETHTQMHFLLRNGCDEMQGFLFSPPIAADRFEELLMLEHVSQGPGRLHLVDSGLAG